MAATLSPARAAYQRLSLEAVVAELRYHAQMDLLREQRDIWALLSEETALRCAGVQELNLAQRQEVRAAALAALASLHHKQEVIQAAQQGARAWQGAAVALEGLALDQPSKLARVSLERALQANLYAQTMITWAQTHELGLSELGVNIQGLRAVCGYYRISLKQDGDKT